MKFRKWRKKLSNDCKRTADNWLFIAGIMGVINIFNFFCILGNIELQMSEEMFFLQLTVFVICTGIILSCAAISKANNYKAVRIKEEGGYGEYKDRD